LFVKNEVRQNRVFKFFSEGKRENLLFEKWFPRKLWKVSFIIPCDAIASFTGAVANFVQSCENISAALCRIEKATHPRP